MTPADAAFISSTIVAAAGVAVWLWFRRRRKRIERDIRLGKTRFDSVIFRAP